MTEHSAKVEYQRQKLEAEKWGNEIRDYHIHSISSMHYDTHPEDTENSNVTDISYNNGTIKRFKKGVHIRTFGIQYTIDELVDKWSRSNI